MIKVKQINAVTAYNVSYNGNPLYSEGSFSSAKAVEFKLVNSSNETESDIETTNNNNTNKE